MTAPLRPLGFLTWLLLTLLSLGQPADRAAVPAPAPGQVLGIHVNAATAALSGKTYVALGDSISAGKYASAADRTFPARVAQQLGMHLVLDARSGATAAWALPVLPEVVATHPALVTIELGTNDVGFKTPLPVFAQEYESIVSAVAAPNTRVLCLSSWLSSIAVDGIISSTCARHGGTFVSLSGFYQDYDFHAQDGQASFLGPADWFHPGDQGHAAIAAAVLVSLPGADASLSAGDGLDPLGEPPASLRSRS
jgi:lysophospholipase L1-like esterase